MTLLDTIKSILGIDDRDSGDERSNDDRGGVTVEHEPGDHDSGASVETGSEEAVKGTDTSDGDHDEGDAGMDEPAATGGDAAGSTESMVDADAEGGAETGEVVGRDSGGEVEGGSTTEPDVSGDAGTTESGGEEPETGTTDGVHGSDTVADNAAGATDHADESAAAGGDAAGSTGSITEEANESISAAENAEAAGPTGADPSDDTAEHDVDVLKGIGPSYAEQLEAAGVETVADLADADPEAIADETDISASRLERWTERAKARRQ